MAKAKKSILFPYIDRFLSEVSQIDQASAEWTLSQFFLLLEKDMTSSQINEAKELLKRNLQEYDDWIVLNTTM